MRFWYSHCRTLQILIKPNEDWGGYSCFELGIATKCYDLVKTEAWQDLLDEAWYGWILKDADMMNFKRGSKFKKCLSWILVSAQGLCW